MEASTVLVREIATGEGVQIFGSVASSRSRLHVAMRNPRHARCSAAIAPASVHRTAWPQARIRFQPPANNGQVAGRAALTLAPA
jgi:hypothetical protein